MIALDTNILVRLFVHDDPDQVQRVERFARGLTPGKPGFVGREVLIELAWVLRRIYSFDRARIADVLGDLLTLDNLRVEAADDAARALDAYRTGGPDFPDLMILAAARRAGAELFTFDRKLAGQSGVTLLEGA